MRSPVSRVATTIFVGLLVVACAPAASPAESLSPPSSGTVVATPPALTPAVATPTVTTPTAAPPSDTAPPPEMDLAIEAVAAGDDHTCVLTSVGGVKCWGGNAAGQLGNGATTETATPGPVDVSGLTSGVSAITAGNAYTCALTNVGGVKCWGYNAYGKLGNVTHSDSSVPLDVSGLPDGIRAISAGHSQTCALTKRNGITCWGANNVGQLGNGTTTDSSVPVDVSGLASGVSAVSAGGLHTCALTSGGGVKCWGYNVYGQLGNGSTTNSTVPVNVSGLRSGVSAITAGQSHTCALLGGGGVKCWGANYDGELGRATQEWLVPRAVGVKGLASGISTIFAGSRHTCALTRGGGVQCWGWNEQGQLGNGTTVKTAPPGAVDVSGLTEGLSAISAGSFHSCAVTSAGGVKCWGDNYGGQLGTLSPPVGGLPVEVDFASSASGGPPGPASTDPIGGFSFDEVSLLSGLRRTSSRPPSARNRRCRMLARGRARRQDRRLSVRHPGQAT